MPRKKQLTDKQRQSDTSLILSVAAVYHRLPTPLQQKADHYANLLKSVNSPADRIIYRVTLAAIRNEVQS